ncbi:hypothetical protein SKB0092_35660 [Roseomonas mucosa]
MILGFWLVALQGMALCSAEPGPSARTCPADTEAQSIAPAHVRASLVQARLRAVRRPGIVDRFVMADLSPDLA